MRKEMAVLARRCDLTVEGFRVHWAERHAPLVAQRPGLVPYVRNDTIDGVRRRHLPEHSGEIDGIEELWFDGTTADEWPPAAAITCEDEERFLCGKTVFVVREIIGYDTAGEGRRDRRISLLRRRDGMSVAAFHTYWSTTHLQLARVHRYADHYAQNHVLAASLRQSLPEVLGAIDGFGVFETADLAAMQASYATASGQALNEDAVRFIAAVSTFSVAAREMPLSAGVAAPPSPALP